MEYVAKALVDEPEQVNVTEVEGERVTVIELRVAQTDLGKVIGKQGRTARALRTILNANATRLRKRAVLEIVEGSASRRTSRGRSASRSREARRACDRAPAVRGEPVKTVAPDGNGGRLVAIGEIGRPYGLAGEGRVTPLTDRPERFETLRECGLWDTARDRPEPCRVTAAPRPGP